MIYQQLFLNPKEHRTAVVFLHAFPLSSQMWEPQFKRLREEKIPFLAIDYPGFGRSPDCKEPPAMADLAREAYSAINRLGFRKVAVVGLSMGGYVALSLYRKYPDIFQGLVLANTRATADSEEGKQRRFKLIDEIKNDPSMKGLIQMHLEKFYTPETRSNKQQLVELAKSLMKEATPGGVIHALQAMAGRPDSTDLLRQIPFPVLVIAGEKDSLTSVEDAQAMTNQLPKGELAIINSAAHLSNLEKSDQFNESLVSYLSNL